MRLRIPLPFLRRSVHLMLSSPDDGAVHTSGLVFGTRLLVDHFRCTGNPKDPRRLVDRRDLGSGIVNNRTIAKPA